MATQIAPGVHRLGTEWINWYLVESGGKLTVVDTAISGYHSQLEPALGAIGRSAAEIEAIVVTHHHVDHVGCAERIRTETGARVLAPAGEAAQVRGEERRGQPAGFASNLWRPAIMGVLAHGVRHGGATSEGVGAVDAYGDGDELDVPGRPRAIRTAGHSPDHHSLHFPEHGVLFTGDALASVDWVSGTTGPQLHPFGEDRARMLPALDALEPLAAELLAFGHGEPFRGSPAEAVARARSLAG